MHVALDTNGTYTTQAGVARHIRGLLRGFEELGTPGFRCTEVAWKVPNLTYRQPGRAMRTLFRECIWIPWVAPRRLRRLQPDLLHSPVGFFIAPPATMKCVVTLHDLAMFRYPDRFRRWQGSSGRRACRRASRADRIICISRFTADECMNYLGFSARRIEVVYNGCDFNPQDPPPPESPPSIEVPGEFVLFVGSLEPGKNLALLRSAYSLASSRGSSLPPLVIVGARWEGVRDEGPPPRNWHYLGRQPDTVLVWLYRRALALVFPSIYEGFGLPVVEAMALGCPVICSPVASLPEVAGQAARMVELRAEDYLDAIQDLLRDDRRRQELIQAGRNQAAQFSWARCARETYRVYEAICSGTHV